MAACALVCKSWLPLAQRSLYRSVTVETTYASRAPGILVPEELLQRSHLLGFTRSLGIFLRDQPPALFSDDSSKLGWKRIPDFFHLLAHTPRLQYLMINLSLAEENVGPFEPHILDWLSSIVLPVEALDVSDGWYFRPTFHCSFVYDLVAIWPTIRALRVSAGDNGPLPERANIRLRELRIDSSNTALSTATIEWLLPPPPPNEQSILRFLSLPKIPEEAHVVLSVHGPSVSTLCLGWESNFEIVHLFPNLEELVLMGPSWSSPLPAFPRTLKHISLGYGSLLTDMLPGNAILAVAQVVPTLPDLRMITVNNKFTANEHYPDLQRVCETHKVEILVASSSFNERPAVSAYERSQLVFDVCHLLTTAISIPITQRWISFLDNTHFPSSSTFGIEVIEKISLGGARTNSSLDQEAYSFQAAIQFQDCRGEQVRMWERRTGG